VDDYVSRMKCSASVLQRSSKAFQSLLARCLGGEVPGEFSTAFFHSTCGGKEVRLLSNGRSPSGEILIILGRVVRPHRSNRAVALALIDKRCEREPLL
jgi:hypothetical protein